MLVSCGFLPNYRKSQLQPTQVLTILGFVVDSVSMTIALPRDKIEKMLTLVNNALIHPRMLVRDLAHLIGKMISCFPALPFGRLYYRPLEHVKIEALFRNKYNYDSYVTIDGACCQCLEWWTLNLPHAVAPIRLFNPTQIIWTDASSYAWGAFHNNTIAHGYFSPLEMPLSINTKETLAILYGLCSFGSSLSSSHTLIRSDSTCAISYVSKMGGMQSELRDKIARDIWEFANSNNMWLSISHIAGSQNLDADGASWIPGVSGHFQTPYSKNCALILNFGLKSMPLHPDSIIN